MSDQYIGEIRVFPTNFAPKDWARCEGQLLSIAQNTALFALLGTFYGGDGRTTFALPDLRGRAPMAFGQAPGLSQRSIGSMGGQEVVTLDATTLPSHTHALSAGGTMKGKNAAGDRQSPSAAAPAIESAGVTATYSNAAADATMRAGGVTYGGTATASAVGSGLPHEHRQPYLGMTYCIALAGIFPPRS